MVSASSKKPKRKKASHPRVIGTGPTGRHLHEADPESKRSRRRAIRKHQEERAAARMEFVLGAPVAFYPFLEGRAYRAAFRGSDRMHDGTRGWPELQREVRALTTPEIFDEAWPTMRAGLDEAWHYVEGVKSMRRAVRYLRKTTDPDRRRGYRRDIYLTAFSSDRNVPRDCRISDPQERALILADLTTFDDKAEDRAAVHKWLAHN